MLPSSFTKAQELRETLSLEPELSSSHNFKLDTRHNRVAGFVDEAEALAQAVFMMISTEQGKYSIYPESYGLKKEDLYGKPRRYVEAALKHRIPECLLQDLRIKAVENLEFNFYSDICIITADLKSVFGDITVKTEIPSLTTQY